jgi:hypothetical protein
MWKERCRKRSPKCQGEGRTLCATTCTLCESGTRGTQRNATQCSLQDRVAGRDKSARATSRDGETGPDRGGKGKGKGQMSCRWCSAE